MNRGILIVAFGKEYDKLAAYITRHSRQFINLPICVLTNIKNRCEVWEEVSGVTFIEFSMLQNGNRWIKTQMIKYTPFDETLYLDCDAVIQNSGVEDAFNQLGDKDILLSLFTVWGIGDKIVNIYKNALLKTETTLPINVYNGSFVCFKNNHKTKEFFVRWHKFWEITGSGRDMPALACAVKHSSMSVGISRANFFEQDTYKPDAIIQHNYNSSKNKNFITEFNLPSIRQYKPFDGNRTDWNWVEMNE